MSIPFDWRYVLKVRTRDVTRILNGLTHPTQLGASAMKLQVAEKHIVPPELLLLLEVLQEECGADIVARDIIESKHIDSVPHPQRPTFLSPRDSQILDGTERLPLPPPPMVCEFDLGLSAKQFAAGRILNVIFWMMIFSMEGINRVMPRSYDNGQEAGSDSETSGIWGIAARRERPAKATARDIKPKRAAGT